MSKMTFDWGQDREGNVGWMARGYPHFNPTLPQNFSHDALEHLPGGLKHGQLADELMALGVRWWIRVHGGFAVNGFYSPAGGMAGEVNRLLDYAHHGTPEPAPIVESPIPEFESDIGDIMKRVVGQRRDAIAEGFKVQMVKSDDPLLLTMVHWMRRGYRAAQKRYRGASPFAVGKMMEKIDRQAMWMAGGEEGDSLVVEVREKDLSCSIKRVANQ